MELETEKIKREINEVDGKMKWEEQNFLGKKITQSTLDKVK
jgi:hypothetical protein